MWKNIVTEICAAKFFKLTKSISTNKHPLLKKSLLIEAHSVNEPLWWMSTSQHFCNCNHFPPFWLPVLAPQVIILLLTNTCLLPPHLSPPVAALSLTSLIEKRFAGIERRLDEICGLLHKLTYSRASRSPDRHRHRSPTPHKPKSQHHIPARSRSPSQSRQNGLCWYHTQFGVHANKCIDPCSFPKNG